MKRAVLFFDIDGTLLSEVTKKIPDSAAESVRRAKKAGHMLFINTGRTICSIPAEIRRLPFDGYLCGCGTYWISVLLLRRFVDTGRRIQTPRISDVREAL